MGFFKKDPIEKFLSGRSERLSNFIINSECYGTCGLMRHVGYMYLSTLRSVGPQFSISQLSGKLAALQSLC